MPTTLSGTIRNLQGGTVGSAQNAILRFHLRGVGAAQPTVSGAVLAPASGNNLWYFDFPADSNGNVSGTLYSTRDSAGTGAGDIFVSGVGTAVYYDMVVIANNMSGPAVSIHAKNGSTLDPSSVSPITSIPVVSAPTGDTTYLKLTGGNGPITGSLTIQGALTLNSTVNKVTITAPATGSTLTVADGKTLASSNTLTLAGTDGTTLTFQGTDTYVGRATTDTLSNKTLAGTVPYNRIRANQGSALVSGDWSLGGNWGTSPSLSSIMGTDSAGAVTVTAGTGSPGANPTLSLTFHDGAWPTAPIVVFAPGGGSPLPHMRFHAYLRCSPSCSTRFHLKAFQNGNDVQGRRFDTRCLEMIESKKDTFKRGKTARAGPRDFFLGYSGQDHGRVLYVQMGVHAVGRKMKRDDRLDLRMSKAERRKVRAAAKLNKLSEAEYARRRIMGALLTDKRKPKRGQEDAPEGRTAGFVAEFGREAASEQEFFDWWLEQECTDPDILAGMEESDRRMAQLPADRQQYERNREREGKLANQIQPSLPESPVMSNGTTSADSEAQRAADVQKAVDDDRKRTAALTGIML